jgi:hypothetical protein
MELQFIFVLPSMPGGSHPRDGVTPTHVGVHYALQVDLHDMPFEDVV